MPPAGHKSVYFRIRPFATHIPHRTPRRNGAAALQGSLHPCRRCTVGRPTIGDVSARWMKIVTNLGVVHSKSLSTLRSDMSVSATIHIAVRYACTALAGPRIVHVFHAKQTDGHLKSHAGVFLCAGRGDGRMGWHQSRTRTHWPRLVRTYLYAVPMYSRQFTPLFHTMSPKVRYLSVDNNAEDVESSPNHNTWCAHYFHSIWISCYWLVSLSCHLYVVALIGESLNRV